MIFHSDGDSGEFCVALSARSLLLRSKRALRCAGRLTLKRDGAEMSVIFRQPRRGRKNRPSAQIVFERSHMVEWMNEKTDLAGRIAAELDAEEHAIKKMSHPEERTRIVQFPEAAIKRCIRFRLRSRMPETLLIPLLLNGVIRYHISHVPADSSSRRAFRRTLKE